LQRETPLTHVRCLKGSLRRVRETKDLYLHRERPDEIAVQRPLRRLSQTERRVSMRAKAASLSS
jgi:hypothetical protein